MELHEFLERNRKAVLEHSLAIVRNRPAPPLDDGELEDGVPVFFEQLIETLRSQEPHEAAGPPPTLRPKEQSTIGVSANRSGKNLLRLGFSVRQVIHIYGTICEAVNRTAKQFGQEVSVDDYTTLNRCLDDAMGEAVTEFEHGRDEATATRENERLGFLVHEMRNALSTAMLAMQALKHGAVGFGGKTAATMERSHLRMRDLIDRSLTEIRLHADAQPMLEKLNLREVVSEIEATARPDADLRSIRLQVQVDAELVVIADRQMLVSAIANLVQNAVKYSRLDGQVTVRGSSTDKHVVVEVEDECGGLPPGVAEELFRPFVRKTTEPTGVGLGLPITRRAAEAMGGRVLVRNLAEKGCVFAIHLPRS